MNTIVYHLGNAMYGVLVLQGLYGAYLTVVVWMRLGRLRFKDERTQNEFLDLVEGELSKPDVSAAMELCEEDDRAVPQLTLLAIVNRKLGFGKVRQLIIDRFQRDVLADLEYRMSWINTMIKSAPMVGLLGTVVGMMAAFGMMSGGGAEESANKTADQAALATNISIALITTAMGLTIAIPLLVCVAAINIRIRKLEDLVSAGLSRFFDVFKDRGIDAV
jgi:biopolymer transport protein ExbB